VMDASLMLGFALILVTGLVISSWLALALENYAAWRNIHVIASVATLLIIVVKIGLHSRWMSKLRGGFLPPLRLRSPAFLCNPSARRPRWTGAVSWH